jgi:hypothetical protein
MSHAIPRTDKPTVITFARDYSDLIDARRFRLSDLCAMVRRVAPTDERLPIAERYGSVSITVR